MELERYLEKRLERVAVEREQVLVRLEKIREKMKRADKKRSGQPDTSTYKKWSSILRSLEDAYDQHKSIITSLDAEMKKKTDRLERIRAEHRNDQCEENSKDYDQVMAIIFEDEILLQEQGRKILEDEEAVESTRLESFPSPPAESAPTSPSLTTWMGEIKANSNAKHVIQSALNKARQGAILELTFNEAAAVLAVYQKLVSESRDDPAIVEMEEDISGAMWEVCAHSARICANWADLMRRDVIAGGD